MTLKNSCLVVIFLVINGIGGIYSSCRVVPQQDAIDAAYASKYVYEDKDEGIIPHTKYKITKVYNDPEKKFRAIAAEKDKTTMIIFRGTVGFNQLFAQFFSGLGDLLAKAPETEFGEMGISVQSYMKDGFEKLLNTSLKIDLTDASRKYIITGHSLGGCFADLLGLYATAHKDTMKVWNNEESSIITFGQPRIGGKQYADLDERKIPAEKKLRFVYRNDIVPHIPSRDTYLNLKNKTDGKYKHHSREVWISTRNDMVKCPRWSWRNRKSYRSCSKQKKDMYVKFCKPMDTLECSNKLKLRFKGNYFAFILQLPTFIKHHRMDNYIDNIKDSTRFYNKDNSKKNTWASAAC